MIPTSISNFFPSPFGLWYSRSASEGFLVRLDDSQGGGPPGPHLSSCESKSIPPETAAQSRNRENVSAEPALTVIHIVFFYCINIVCLEM